MGKNFFSEEEGGKKLRYYSVGCEIIFTDRMLLKRNIVKPDSKPVLLYRWNEEGIFNVPVKSWPQECEKEGEKKDVELKGIPLILIRDVNGKMKGSNISIRNIIGNNNEALIEVERNFPLPEGMEWSEMSKAGASSEAIQSMFLRFPRFKF